MNNNDVLATVGTRKITRDDLYRLLSNMDQRTAARFSSQEGIRHLVNELVNQELFYMDAMSKGLDKDEEYLNEVERAKENVLKNYALGKLLSSVTVSDDEISGYYNENKEEFITGPSVRASHILVDNEDEANKVIAEINAGLFFGEAAKKYSKCPSKEQGGDLGYFTRGKMVPEFEDAAFSMEKNQVSKPVKTQFGYHIIKVTDKKDSFIQPLDEVKSYIRNRLLSMKQQEVYTEKINELKKQYVVKVNI